MYAHTIVLNHLVAANQLNVVVLENQLDYPSSNEDSVFLVVHLHSYHTSTMFSKFALKMGAYDGIPLTEQLLASDKSRDYALRIALEAKRMPESFMFELFREAIARKN